MCKSLSVHISDQRRYVVYVPHLLMLLYNNLLLREINKLGEQQMLILTDRLFISAVLTVFLSGEVEEASVSPWNSLA